MPTWTFSIGDTALNLRYDAKTVHLKNTPSVYRPFVQIYEENPPAADMDIVLIPGPGPKTKPAEKIFDSGHALQIYKKNEYIITNTIPGDDQPEWLAEVSPDFKQANIYYPTRIVDGHNNIRAVTNPLQYPLDQILMMFILAKHQGILVHGAGISSKNRGIVFPGVSGAGKSTLMKQFAHNSAWTILSDDRVLLRKINDTPKAFGTPWPGEGGWAENIGVPLKAICFIKQGRQNRIIPISKQAAIEELMPVASIPWYDAALMADCLLICETLVKKIGCFFLEFTPVGNIDHIVGDCFSKYEKSNGAVDG